MISKYKNFILYVFFAIVASLINIGSYLFIYRLTKVVIFSNIIAYLLSFFVTFITNKKYVFKSNSSNYKKEVVMFIFMKIFSFFIDTIVLKVCLYFNFSNIISKLISNSSTVFSNYFISKFLVFRMEDSHEK